MRRGWRRGFGAALLVALAAFVTWACLAGSESHDEDLPPPSAASASSSVEPASATVVSEPSPSGVVLELTAPELVVQSCAIEVTALVSPVDPGAPLVAATLTVSSAGGVVFEGAPTLLDPATGLATWAIERMATEAWPVGPITVLATAQFGNGETIEAALSSEVVAMNVLWIEFEGERYDDGGVINVSCIPTPPIPLQPSTPNGGYLTPSGGTITCGPVLTYATILPPNLNAQGQIVLSISASPATSFSITVEAPGEAQVQFASPQVPGPTVTLKVKKPAPQEQPEVQVYIEGIIFNWDKTPASKDGLNIRMYARDAPAKDGMYPDDLIHTPLYPGGLGEDENVAWLPRREDKKEAYKLAETLDSLPAGEMFQDSAAVYSAKLTDPKEPIETHVLFRVDVIKGKLPADQQTIDIDIRTEGNPQATFWEQTGRVNTVTFELKASLVTGHRGHLHSAEGPEDKTGAPSSIRHLRRNYVSFKIKAQESAFKAYGWHDDTLIWKFREPFTGEWRDVKYKVPNQEKPPESNETHHRIYVLLDDPKLPWRLVPGPDEGDEQGKPHNLNAPEGREPLLKDPALPWTHVLDELLSKASVKQVDPTRPGSGDAFPFDTSGPGAVGDFAAASPLTADGQRGVALRTTIYVQRHDMAQDVGGFPPLAVPPGVPPRKFDRHPSGLAFYFGENKGSRAGHNTAPNRPGIHHFRFSESFFMHFSFKPRARLIAGPKHESTAVCYDLAALNKLFATLLGVPLRMQIEEIGSTDIRAPVQLWGVTKEVERTGKDGKKEKVTVRDTLQSATVSTHAFNVLGDGVVVSRVL